MLTINQLTKQQRVTLKESLLTEIRDTVSTHDLANAETIVSDDELNAKYGDTVFSPDDFCDTTGMTDSDCILQHYKDFRLTRDITALKDTIVEEIQKTANAAAEAILTDAQLDQDEFRNDLVESIYNAIADKIIGKAW